MVGNELLLWPASEEGELISLKEESLPGLMGRVDGMGTNQRDVGGRGPVDEEKKVGYSGLFKNDRSATATRVVINGQVDVVRRMKWGQV